ncbi:MAG TPA: DUF2231 domain-containing protein [Bacteroidota bacterium]|nr:DUF2231 domain-containing protein [Bacteroidota bacterium]
MPNIHPLIVHFPVALLTVSLVFELLGVALKRDDLERTAWWLLLAGCVGLGGAVATGLLAEKTVMIPAEVSSQFETHQEMAFLATTAYAIIILWRISNKTLLPQGMRSMYLLLTVAALVAIWVGAWFGGEMVYGSGVGVKVTP